MPNWVSNSLTVSSEGVLDNPEMIEFLSLVGKDVPQGWAENDKGEKTELRYDNNGGFSFLAFVAPPADKIEEYYGKKGWVNGEEVGNTEYNWYNWNLTNFGCKWDCSEVYIHTEDPTSFFQVSFETPWSPPEEFVQSLVKRFPSLSITLNWEEEQGFGAEWTTSEPDENGERTLTVVEEWDIPNSHEDYEKRDKECYCSWEDDPNNWFEDCPDRAEAILDWNKEHAVSTLNGEEPDLVYG